MTQTTLPARLLAQETIEVLDGACEPRPRVVTRHDIEHDVTALLTRGLTTTSAGGFFFIPYLLQLGAYDLAAALGPAKHEGIPKERLALGLVFESIFGYTAGIRAVDMVSRADFGLLAGLPFLPSPSTQYRFLQDVPVKSALDFQTALGRRLVALAQVTPGHPVNIDGHNVKTYSRKAMKHAFITQEDRYGKAIRTFYTQDQASKKPLMALAAYSGTTVSQVTHRLAGLTRDILGRDFLLVADKEWCLDVTRLANVASVPAHATTVGVIGHAGGIVGPIVNPGDPASSVMMIRMSSSEIPTKMPPLGTETIDP